MIEAVQDQVAAVIFLGESLSSTAMIGFVCIVAGVAAMSFPSRSLQHQSVGRR